MHSGGQIVQEFMEFLRAVATTPFNPSIPQCCDVRADSGAGVPLIRDSLHTERREVNIFLNIWNIYFHYTIQYSRFHNTYSK